MDTDNGDIASPANLKTLDGTPVLTGSSKQTTYVPRYVVPNTALGESYKTCEVEGILPTEHQLKQGVLKHGSYPDLVNNAGPKIMSHISSTGDTSGEQVPKAPTGVFVQSLEAGKALKGLTFSGSGNDTYYNISNTTKSSMQLCRDILSCWKYSSTLGTILSPASRGNLINVPYGRTSYNSWFFSKSAGLRCNCLGTTMIPT